MNENIDESLEPCVIFVDEELSACIGMMDESGSMVELLVEGDELSPDESTGGIALSEDNSAASQQRLEDKVSSEGCIEEESLACG